MGSQKASPSELRSPLAAEHIAAIWVAAARELGWQVVRGTSAYASTDGKGTYRSLSTRAWTSRMPSRS